MTSSCLPFLILSYLITGTVCGLNFLLLQRRGEWNFMWICVASILCFIQISQSFVPDGLKMDKNQHCFKYWFAPSRWWAITKNDVVSVQWLVNITATSNGLSNYRSIKCLFSSLVRLTTRKHQSSVLLFLCEGNTPMTGGFHAQWGNNAEKVSIRRRHNDHASMGHVQLLVIVLIILKWSFVFG